MSAKGKVHPSWDGFRDDLLGLRGLAVEFVKACEALNARAEALTAERAWENPPSLRMLAAVQAAIQDALRDARVGVVDGDGSEMMGPDTIVETIDEALEVIALASAEPVTA